MGRRVLGSVVATLSGWAAGWILLDLIYGCGNEWFRHPGWYLVQKVFGIFLLMGVVIVPVWAVMVLPIYLSVPKGSYFSKKSICVPFGGLVGFVIIQGFFTYSEYSVYHSSIHAWDIVWPLSIPGAVVGAVTSLVANLTYDRFNQSFIQNENSN